MSLPLPFSIAIEQGIEALLRLDPETRSKLAALENKVIEVNVTSPRVSVAVSIVGGRVYVVGELNSPADATLSGSLTALRSLSQGNDALYTGEVTIEGDIGIGQQLKEILAGLDPDWEECLSPIVGDTIVHRMSVAGETVHAWFTRTLSSIEQDTGEYLQEEVELLAPNSEVREYCLEVDEVRAAGDRLEARVRRLERVRENGEGEGAC